MLRLQDKHRQTRFSRSASARRSPQPLPETVGLLAPQYKHQRHDQLCFLSDGLSCLGYHCSETHDASITKTVLSPLHSEVVSCLGYHYSETHDANITKTVLSLLHSEVVSCLGYHYSETYDTNITKTFLSLCFTQFCPALVTTTHRPTMQTSLRPSSLCFTQKFCPALVTTTHRLTIANIVKTVLCLLHLDVLFSWGYYYSGALRCKHHQDGLLSASLRGSVLPWLPLLRASRCKHH